MEHLNTTPAKIPILDTGKFEQWQFRIQQYLQHEHYALWEVIEFRYSYEVPTTVAAIGSASEGTATKTGMTVAFTTKDMQKRKNDVKARTTLLLVLLDEHQLRFSKYKTVQELWDAILKIIGAKSSSGKEDVNTTSIPTASTIVSPASVNIRAISIQGTDVTGFDKSKVECFNCHKMGHFARECRAPRSQDMGRRDNYRQGSKVEEQAPKALMTIDGMGCDWSFMANEEDDHALVADEEAPTEFALMAKTNAESKVFDNSLCFKNCKKNTESLNSKITDLTDKLYDSKNMLFHYKEGLSQVEGRLVEFKNQEIKFCEKIRVLEFSVECKTIRIENLTNELETLKKEKEGLESKLTGLLEFVDDTITDYIRPSPSVKINPNDLQNSSSSTFENGESIGGILSKPEIKFVRPVESPTVAKSDKKETVRKPFIKYFELYRKPIKRVDRGSSWAKNNNTHKSKTPRTVFYKTGRPPTRTNRPYMNDAQPKRTSFYKPVHSYNKRPFQRTSAVRSQFRGPRVANVNRKFPTVNRKLLTVNRKFPTGNTKFSTADMGNKGKAGNSQNHIDDKGYWDSGCSRHMTGNISYLFDYEPFDRGYVSFGQGGCKITGKGTIKTGKLEFENMYFVKDLKDFKMIDDTNVLLRTPRQHNMYSIDLNNIVPHKDLTCLVAKASAEECMNFKTEIENLKEFKVKISRCDNRGEFRNKEMNDFCSRKGIKREFSNARTPPQNGVAERRNKTLIEAARTILADAKLPVTFWAEAVNTACYVSK
nr:putative ribonuclease H-like domain-containing protein [Tanacetum cinerariifolium]